MRAGLALTMMISIAVLACDKTVPTPPGTVVLDLPSMTKLSVTDWSLGPPKGAMTKVDKKYHYVGGDIGHDVRFSVSFEHGDFELREAKPKADPPPAVPAPRAIKITVLENDQWAITSKCDDYLAVPLAVNKDGTSAYPKNVWLSCRVVMRRKNGDITAGPHLDLYGDGTIKGDVLGSGEKLVEE